MGFLFLAAGILVLLSFASFHPADPSWNTVSETRAAQNLIGPAGSWFADFFLQAFGLAAFVFPVLMFGLGWKWIRSEVLAAPVIKIFGSATLVASCCGVAALLPDWRIFDRTIMPGGAVGFLAAGALRNSLNLAGSAVVLATALIVSVYLVPRSRWLRLRSGSHRSRGCSQEFATGGEGSSSVGEKPLSRSGKRSGWHTRPASPRGRLPPHLRQCR